MMAIEPIPVELRYPYPPGKVYSEPLTTDIRSAATKAFNMLEATTDLSRGSFPELFKALWKQGQEEGGDEALVHSRRLLLTLSNLGVVMAEKTELTNRS